MRATRCMDDSVAFIGDRSNVGGRDPDGDDGIVAELHISIESHLFVNMSRDEECQLRNRGWIERERASSHTTGVLPAALIC